MRSVLLSSLSVILFASVIAMSTSVSAQNRTCNLQLNVVEMSSVPTDDVKPISGARAIATRIGGRRLISAIMLDGQPHFSNLPVGVYKFTITKPGYQRTIQQIEFGCTIPDSTASTYIILRRGRSSLTITNEKLNVSAGNTSIEGLKMDSVDRDSGPLSPPPVASPPPSSGKVISGGVLNGKAIRLPKPEYPAIARTAKASGQVTVQVMLDEEGNVISASAVNGHPLLRAAAVDAARAAKFTPTLLSGQRVKLSGVIIYNFSLPQPEEPNAETD